MTGGGAQAVRDAVENAEEAVGAPPTGLRSGCPVEPLGLNGDVFWYLDANRQLRAVKARDHGRLVLQSLFGTRIDLLEEFWPRLAKGGKKDGFAAEDVAKDLMCSAAARGVWDPFERVRGPGAWLDARGALVLHCGDSVWHGPDATDKHGEWRVPGREGRYVYPAAPPGPRPAATPEANPGEAAQKVLAMLRTWEWRRPEIDPILMLGWIGAAIVGGALDWRPLVWVTGDKGTGKSTLHKLVHGLLDEAVISVSDATAAGVWQKLAQSSLPVAVDELEAEEDSRRAQNIIKLARQAASGGVVLRGGSDHQGAEFKARSCFMFSSILVPALMGQDLSRMAILELDRLSSSTPPPLDRNQISRLGSLLRHRMANGWHGLAERLRVWAVGLEAVGHSGRGADQFGTLLACADMLLHDTPPCSDSVEEWTTHLGASDLAEVADIEADHERCIRHLMSSLADIYRQGERRTIAELVKAAASDNYATADDAGRMLGTYGLRIVRDGGQVCLAIANMHQGLAALFKDTHWAGRSGASGVWAQAVRRMEGARAAGALRFNGVVSRATVVPLSVCIDGGGT